MLKEAELFCEADLLGMLITRGFDFGCNLNAITNTAVGTTAAVGAVDM